MSLSILWNRLLRIKNLRLEAESFQPIWRGIACGQVVLSEINQNTIIFSESGEWDFAEKPKIKFFNIYRWRKAGNEILELSHLRNGLDFPVHLLDFKQTSEREWRSEKPHVCREDLYGAVLLIENDKISLKWTIKGPTKSQIVESIYQ